VPTSFPTFVDVPEGEEPEPGTPDVDADYLNSVGVAINTIENSLPGFVEDSDLATVATTGAYTDLIGAPFIPSAPGDVGAQPAGSYQTLDSDLTAIAGLSPTDNDVLQRKSGAWTNRTPAQLKTDLSLAKADVGLGNADNTSDANKPISTATQAALDDITDVTDTHTTDLDELDKRVDSMDGISTVGDMGGNRTLNPGSGNGVVKIGTLDQDCNITFGTGSANGRVKSLELVLTQGGVGSWEVTWVSTIRWEGGVVPALSTTAGAIDRFVFTTYDDGVTWYGDVIGKGYV
jgi:hypothetical protein